MTDEDEVEGGDDGDAYTREVILAEVGKIKDDGDLYKLSAGQRSWLKQAVKVHPEAVHDALEEHGWNPPGHRLEANLGVERQPGGAGCKGKVHAVLHRADAR